MSLINTPRSQSVALPAASHQQPSLTVHSKPQAPNYPPVISYSAAKMNEDARYRSSTQYRFWSFTKSALAAQRETTNRIATDRVKAAFARARDHSGSSTPSDGLMGGKDTGSDDVQCLTPEEESRLLVFYCRQALALGDHLKVPTDVKATAIIYLKRFYTTNSLMTYHPTLILKTALFFSTKTENHYYRLSKFCESIGKTKEEDVLASEFLLTQGLRFTFDVRHPFRALEGAVMEIQGLGDEAFDALPDSVTPGAGVRRPENISRRAREAHGKAKEILKTSALISDVYFHYTPSQIMFASLLAADEELATWYLSLKTPDMVLYQKILTSLQSCRGMLESVQVEGESEDELKELKVLNKKLQRCRNPEMKNLVEVNKAKREEGLKRDDNGEMVDEKVIKKRKLEREGLAKEGEDLFGPALRKG